MFNSIAAVPDKPTGPIKFSDVQPTSLIVEWAPPKKDGGSKVTGYKLQMTSDMVTWDDVTITERTDQKVKKLTTDQPYHFRVIAFNDVGESKPLDSDEIVCRVPKGNLHFAFVVVYKMLFQIYSIY